MKSTAGSFTQLSIVLIGVMMVFSVLGNSAYSDHVVGSGGTINVVAAEGSNTISISGTTDRSGEVIVKVLAPNGNVISVSQLSPSDGSFMTTVETGGALWSQDGMYTISAYQGAASSHQKTAQVEVIDGHVIPEFGVIAAMILAVAIVSIIVVTAKTKLSIVPRY